MKRIKAVESLTEKELKLYGPSVLESYSASWHADYADSPYIYVGGLNFDLTEGDIRVVFSQYVLVVFQHLSNLISVEIWESNRYQLNTSSRHRKIKGVLFCGI